MLNLCKIDGSLHIVLIHKWANESALKSPMESVQEAFPGADLFEAVFTSDYGQHGKAQALEAVLDADAIVRDRGSLARLVLMGRAWRSAVRKKRTRKILLCFFLLMLMFEVGKVLAVLDVLLVHLRNSPLFLNLHSLQNSVLQEP